MKIRQPKPKRRSRTSKKPSDSVRSHRVKITGRLTLEELSHALQMGVARMEDRGHTLVGSVSLYYRPVDGAREVEDNPHTIEIRLPQNPPAKE